jgi:DNA-directed RNA polymerase II subunit RPB2
MLCCVTGETKVLLLDNTYKQIKDINENDIVLSVCNKTLDYIGTKTINRFKLIPEKLFKLTTVNGNTIKATGDHPFLVAIENNNVWINLEELKINDNLILFKNYKYFVEHILSIEEIPIEPVYDFTTVNLYHSFVANNFIVHNCVETPEGPKIGMVKSVAMMASITSQNNSQEIILTTILKENLKIKHPGDINPLDMNLYVKIFINGNWYGVIKIKYAIECFNNLKEKRKNNIIEQYTSMLFDYEKKEIRIYFDGGRLIRPLLIVNNNEINLIDVYSKLFDETSIKNSNSIDKNKGWKNIFIKYKNIIEYEDIETLNYLMVADRYEKLIESVNNSKRKIEYSDISKVNRYGDYKYINYTHCEFPGWVMLGTTVANVPFLNHDYATKGIVHYSHAKQTMGLYLTSYKDRMDISQVLYHPQIPIAQTKAMKYNSFLDMPYGENAVIALECYTGLLISSSHCGKRQWLVHM